jgi:Nif-specific regulatory protein
MNANTHPPTGIASSTSPTFLALEGMVAILTSIGGASEVLRRVFDRLGEFGLVRACTMMLRGDGSLAPPADDSKAVQEITGRARAILAAGKVGVLRDGETPLLGAPIRANGRTLGLLTAETEGGTDTDRARLLGLVGNLIGPPLILAGHAPLYSPDPHEIVGGSPLLRSAVDLARRIAPVNLTVLLRGESGSGKELFARFIHDHSPRANKPFIKVSCPSLTETTLASELFGHERGAFTGAVAQRQGSFELAHGGTLLLDEIGDLHPSFQAGILRVLQEGEFERVGGGETIKVDVRVIATTHRDLEEAVRRGTFRADLYYRIAKASIRLPALREHREDVPALAQHILSRFNAENRRALTLNEPSIKMLSKCAFPGNVRELENCLRAAATMACGKAILKRDFACRNRSCFSDRLRSARVRAARRRAAATL